MPSTRLCTVDDVKNNGNVDTNYTYDDEGIVRAIRAATTQIIAVTRRDWDVALRTENMSLPRSAVRGKISIWSRVRPILLTPVAPSILWATQFSGPFTPLTASQFEVEAAKGRINMDPNVFLDLRVVYLRLSYWGGLANVADDADVYDAPADMKQACAMQASYLYDRMINNMVGVKQFAGKTGSTTYNALANGLVPEAHALIAHYIRPLTGG